jgi:hypothetical protein
MIFGEGFLGLVLVGLWIFCINDVITTDESQVRNLPKLLWLLIVLLIPDIGSIAWLIAGRNWNGAAARPPARSSIHPSARGYAEYDRPGRYVPANPDDDEDFLRSLRERAEEQRRSYQDKRAAELKDEEDRLKKPPSDDA